MSEQKVVAWRPMGWPRWSNGAPSKRTELSHINKIEYAYTKAEPDQLLDQLAEALRKVMDNNCPMTGNPTNQELVEFWQYEASEGRGEATDMLAALSALSAYDARRKA